MKSIVLVTALLLSGLQMWAAESPWTRRPAHRNDLVLHQLPSLANERDRWLKHHGRVRDELKRFRERLKSVPTAKPGVHGVIPDRSAEGGSPESEAGPEKAAYWSTIQRVQL